MCCWQHPLSPQHLSIDPTTTTQLRWRHMKLQALTDTGLLMASIFLSISCVYMLLMLRILPRLQARVPLSQGVTGSVQNFTAVVSREGYQEGLQGQGTGERVPLVYPCDSVVVSLTDRHHMSDSFTIQLAPRMVYPEGLQTRLRGMDPFRSF